MLVADAVADALAGLGADTVFGLVGSGNFHVTNGLIARGARFVAARHECGAASMADSWARLAGRPGLLSVHQGPGLTNALTGITEAAKSRTPLVVVTAEATSPRSNFFVDQPALAEAVGAVSLRVTSPGEAARQAGAVKGSQVAKAKRAELAGPLYAEVLPIIRHASTVFRVPVDISPSQHRSFQTEF